MLRRKLMCLTSLQLSALVLLCGCGGVAEKGAGATLGGVGTPDPGPPAVSLVSDWQFSTTSTVGMPPLTIAGSINQSGSSVSSAVHVAGGSCFDQQNVIGLTGTLTDGNVSLTSVSVDGQVITFAGNITTKANFPDTLTGTYAINGGCANGDQGGVAGYSVDAFNGSWYGNLTTAGGANIHWGTDDWVRLAPARRVALA